MLIIYPTFEIRKNDIKGKMLRPQFKQKRFAPGRLPNLSWQPWQTSPNVSDIPNVPLHIYICRSFTNQQLF